MTQISPQQLAKYIDHTLLKPEATDADVRKLCAEAREYKFSSVCVNGSSVKLAAELLAGSGVNPIAVVGFPLGAATSASKAFEARDAVANGAREIDMVCRVGSAREGRFDEVQADIAEVVKAVPNIPVKVILETCLLNDEQIVAVCKAAEKAGAAFVKTSTGFSTGGATKEVVALMRKTVGTAVQVKASGGIRTTADALAMIDAGATRLGASASVAIVTGVAQGGAGY